MPLERKCGECRACCISLDIDTPELKKPKDIPCSNLCEKGCSIYETRFPVCREFICGWKQFMGKPDMRPDKSGILLYGMNTKFGPAVGAKELWPGAGATPEAEEMLQGIAKERLVWLIREDGSRSVLGPDPNQLRLIASLANGRAVFQA